MGDPRINQVRGSLTGRYLKLEEGQPPHRWSLMAEDGDRPLAVVVLEETPTPGVVDAIYRAYDTGRTNGKSLGAADERRRWLMPVGHIVNHVLEAIKEHRQ